MRGSQAQEELDVFQLAAQDAVFDRRFSLSDFDRLRGLLIAENECDGRGVGARFEFSRARGRPVALVEVAASLPLVCQRCLRPVNWPVASVGRIAFVEGTSTASDEVDGREPYETRGGRVRLIEVVEEELLLALPLVATHGSPALCEQLASPMSALENAGPAGDAQRPFAGLKELLGGK